MTQSNSGNELGAKGALVAIFAAPVVVGLTNPLIPETILNAVGLPVTDGMMTAMTLMLVVGPLMIIPPLYTMFRDVEGAEPEATPDEQ